MSYSAAMPDNLSPEQRRRTMQAVRSRNTRLEVRLRSAVHARGLRFRIHRKDLPGTPDLVFPRWKAVVFVHGCFWHGHRCPRAALPATRTDYWAQKQRRNQQRDGRAIRKLRSQGWRVRVLWECGLKDLDRIAAQLERWLRRSPRPY
jgi:DNA mismatch endonuclease (patch repair protein)